jgi:hypothetical protein
MSQTAQSIEIQVGESATFAGARIHRAQVYGTSGNTTAEVEGLVMVGDLVVSGITDSDCEVRVYTITHVEPEQYEGKRPFTPAPLVRRVRIAHVHTIEAYNARMMQHGWHYA